MKLSKGSNESFLQSWFRFVKMIRQKVDVVCQSHNDDDGDGDDDQDDGDDEDIQDDDYQDDHEDDQDDDDQDDHDGDQDDHEDDQDDPSEGGRDVSVLQSRRSHLPATNLGKVKTLSLREI